jgi:hypothetical protein
MQICIVCKNILLIERLELLGVNVLGNLEN